MIKTTGCEPDELALMYEIQCIGTISPVSQWSREAHG